MKTFRPMVSCIMPTSASRRDLAARAIECFLAQTYEPRELVVLSRDPMNLPHNHRIRYERITAKYEIPLGTVRNRCCLDAAGEVIAHWDDDDWSAPHRLEVQVEHLCSGSPARVAGLRSMFFWDRRHRKAYFFANPGPIVNLGTSLIYDTEWWLGHPFPKVNGGEDLAFVRQASAAGVLSLHERLDLIVAIEHGANTCRRNFHAQPFQKIELSQLPAGFLEHKAAA